ncbi:MAG: GTPase ObgE, partial [Pirellulaceae bacterium]|nr:GTPase ObgE [Pirellulaceae bacterium]
EKGKNGAGDKRHGKSAPDLTIEVPVGTVVIDPSGPFVIKDLSTEGDSFIAARGGKGGKGNAHFKSATNRAPREYTDGGEGEQRRVILELKMIADVGLLGKPNAGKSTLLSRISKARPRIASYPFTTLVPNLGHVQIDFDRSFVMADIPGLIEGAAEGAGLGHDFLRHVERAGILVHLVEPSPLDGTEPIENYLVIRKELEHYNPVLAKRPEIVVVTKGEMPDAPTVQKELAEKIDRPVLLISSVSGIGLDQLVNSIDAAIKKQKEAEAGDITF